VYLGGGDADVEDYVERFEDVQQDVYLEVRYFLFPQDALVLALGLTFEDELHQTTSEQLQSAFEVSTDRPAQVIHRQLPVNRPIQFSA
jgi:hypothetical protein